MTERAQSADFHRKPLIFTDSPLLLEIQAFEERRKPQQTAEIFATEDFRRKPQEIADWAPSLGPSPLARPYLEVGIGHLRLVNFGNGPNTVSGSTVSNTELSEFFWAH